MVYKKASIKNDDSEFLDKTLSSRYNSGYEFKWISIKEIQAIYILIL